MNHICLVISLFKFCNPCELNEKKFSFAPKRILLGHFEVQNYENLSKQQYDRQNEGYKLC